MKKFLRLGKNNAQQENILNQLVTKIRTLRDGKPKKTKRGTKPNTYKKTDSPQSDADWELEEWEQLYLEKMIIKQAQRFLER